MNSFFNNKKKIELPELTSPKQQQQKRSSLVTPSTVSLKKVQINEPDDGKQKEDQYVGKLHAHITFLNKTVKEMKKKQDEYKNGLVDMLSRDAKPLPDLATDSQAKYKSMKQELIADINDLENKQAKAINKHIGLLKRKEKFKALLEMLEKKHTEIEQVNKKKNNDIKDKLKKEIERREEMDEEVEKWKQQYEKNVQEYEQKMKEIKEKKFLEDLVNERYAEEKKIEEDDETEKRAQCEKVEKEIKDEQQKQLDDFNYSDLKNQYDDLTSKLRDLGEDYDKKKYKSYELEQLVKLGEAEKDKEAEERKKLRDEYDKQYTILEDYKRKNRERVETQFNLGDCSGLKEIMKKHNKIIKTGKDQLEKFTQYDIIFKKLKIEELKKKYQIERLRERVKEKQVKSSALNQEVNEREVEYLELHARIVEEERALAKLRKEDEKLTKTHDKLVQEEQCLQVRADNYEQTVTLYQTQCSLYLFQQLKQVQLQELVQKLEFSELDKTHQSNLLFMEGLRNLKELKNQVRTQHNYSYQQ